MNNHQKAAPDPSRRAADKLGIEREGGIFSPGQRRDFLAWKAGLDALAKWDQDQDYIDYLEAKVAGLEKGAGKYTAAVRFESWKTATRLKMVYALDLAGTVSEAFLRFAFKSLLILFALTSVATACSAWHYHGMTPQAIQADQNRTSDELEATLDAMERADKAREARHE